MDNKIMNMKVKEEIKMISCKKSTKERFDAVKFKKKMKQDELLIHLLDKVQKK